MLKVRATCSHQQQNGCLRMIVIVTVKADGPNMFASSHLIGVVSVQIYAATELKFEQSKGENEKRLEALCS